MAAGPRKAGKTFDYPLELTHILIYTPDECVLSLNGHTPVTLVVPLVVLAVCKPSQRVFGPKA